MLKRIIYSLHGNVYFNLGLFDIAIIHIKYCRLDAKGISYAIWYINIMEFLS